MEERLAEQESKGGDLSKQKKKLEGEIQDLKKNVDEVTTQLSKAVAEGKSKENQIRKLQDEMAAQDARIAQLSKEKKRSEEASAKMTEALQGEEDKVNHLSKVKAKLEATLDEAEENLERERRGRADLDKVGWVLFCFVGCVCCGVPSCAFGVFERLSVMWA
jgi:chromosome segregation ATPase